MNIVIAVLAVLVGAVACFAGTRFMKLIVTVVAFIVGWWILTSLISSNDEIVMLLIGVIGGLIGAMLSYFFFQVGLALLGLFIGYQVGLWIMDLLNIAPNNIIGLVIGIVSAIFFVVLALRYQVFMFAVITALVGASLLVAGLQRLLPALNVDLNITPAFALVAFVTLTIVGILVQTKGRFHRILS
ncbi:hypothetical protein MASR2M15_21090 [Anaerolineales bacterium]